MGGRGRTFKSCRSVQVNKRVPGTFQSSDFLFWNAVGMQLGKTAAGEEPVTQKDMTSIAGTTAIKVIFQFLAL